jgi:plastocyanin
MTRAFLACCLCALAIPASAFSQSAARKGKVAPVAKKGQAAPALSPAPAAAPEKASKATAPVTGPAAVEGHVKLPETKSAPVKIQRYQVVSKGGAVAMSPAMAVVYLEGKFPAPASPPKARMVQKDLAFVPALLPVQTGTSVEFPNEDDTYHNVFSFSKPKRFDLGRFLPSERPIPSQIFDKPGMVQLRCDIHEHMWAVLLVLDTPYFTTTDSAGRFKLAGLPSGKFTLKAWISSEKTLELPVELKSGGTLKADFP